jgi:hypothetical protein
VLVTESAPPAQAPAQAPAETPGAMRINEDWLATIVGIVLILLVLSGVIAKGMIP